MRRLAFSMMVALAVSACGSFAADSSLGTWKLNPGKSKSSEARQIKSRTDIREAAPDGAVKMATDIQYADGTSMQYTYTCKYDGKPCPTTGAPFDTISLKRMDANTVTFVVSKAGGKYHMEGKSVVSADGKTRTQTASGTNAEGQPSSHTYVFDRQ